MAVPVRIRVRVGANLDDPIVAIFFQTGNNQPMRSAGSEEFNDYAAMQLDLETALDTAFPDNATTP